MGFPIEISYSLKCRNVDHMCISQNITVTYKLLIRHFNQHKESNILGPTAMSVIESVVKKQLDKVTWTMAFDGLSTFISANKPDGHVHMVSTTVRGRKIMSLF